MDRAMVEQSPLADDKIVLHDEDRFDLTSLAVAVAVLTVRLGLGLTVPQHRHDLILDCSLPYNMSVGGGTDRSIQVRDSFTTPL